MELTRDAIAKVNFTTLKGKFYGIDEVNRFINDLKNAADDIQPKLAAAAELEAKAADYEAQIADYKAQVEALQAKIADYESREKSISSALISSQAAAAEIIASAEGEKQAVLEEAQLEKARLEAGNRQMREDIIRFRRDILIAINGLNQWFEDALNSPRGPLAVSEEEKEEVPAEEVKEEEVTLA
ncbi:MAG: DivIVA domain-containing protein [Firmicutes bacterium]|nr:DivIVA domain-containing protein [Bacillota bacterium]